MSEQIILTSFAELASIPGLSELPSAPTETITDEIGPVAAEGPASTQQDEQLGELLAQLQTAGATLATIARRDHEAKLLAISELDHYETLMAQQSQAERALFQARQLRERAESIAQNAFDTQAREAAANVVQLACHAEDQAALLVEERRQQADVIAGQLDLDRLRAERQQEKARAAAAERARRLSTALSRARAALAAGGLEEARTLLGPVANENPDNAEVTSLLDSIAERAMAVKVRRAEQALSVALGTYREDATGALAGLEALDVDGLPEELGKRVFGGWARVCSAVCTERGLVEPLRYARQQGHGVVFAREQLAGSYVVVSALGMGPGWQPGTPVDEAAIQRARPLPSA